MLLNVCVFSTVYHCVLSESGSHICWTRWVIIFPHFTPVSPAIPVTICKYFPSKLAPHPLHFYNTLHSYFRPLFCFEKLPYPFYFLYSFLYSRLWGKFQLLSSEPEHRHYNLPTFYHVHINNHCSTIIRGWITFQSQTFLFTYIIVTLCILFLWISSVHLRERERGLKTSR